MESQLLELAKIRLDGDTQPRVAIDEQTVKQYAADMERGNVFPPIRVIFDGVAYWLVDGFHRYHAHRNLGRTEIAVEVSTGVLADAQWQSLTANHTHGLRRTNDDKRKAVRKALKMHPELSDHLLADHVGVSHHTIAKYRDLAKPAQTSQTPRVASSTGSVGQVAQLTGNRGHANQARTGKDGKKYHARRRAKPPVSRPAMTPIRGPSKPQEEKVYIGFSQNPAMGARAILELLGHDFTQQLHAELAALLAGTAGLASTLRGTPVDTAS